MELGMAKIVILRNERVKRIIREALAMRPAEVVVGHWFGPEAKTYLQAVRGGAGL
jgi:Flp pilus assembly CpaF family ATPase